jgi:hypothetical protein
VPQKDQHSALDSHVRQVEVEANGKSIFFVDFIRQIVRSEKISFGKEMLIRKQMKFVPEKGAFLMTCLNNTLDLVVATPWLVTGSHSVREAVKRGHSNCFGHFRWTIIQLQS